MAFLFGIIQPYDPVRSLSIDVNDDLRIPLWPHGTKLSFHSRVATADELTDCEHIQMTTTTLWNPSEISMIQETNHGGSGPWKRRLETLTCFDRYDDRLL